LELLDEVRDKLKKYPDAKFESDDCSITVLPNSPDGFRVAFMDCAPEYIVSLGGWHDHFDNTEDALDIFSTGLTSHSRLSVSSRGATEYRWTLELLSGGGWVPFSTDGLLFFPFWRQHVRSIQQNDIIPHPDA
jgi:hypothetical protein